MLELSNTNRNSICIYMKEILLSFGQQELILGIESNHKVIKKENTFLLMSTFLFNANPYQDTIKEIFCVTINITM